MKPKQSLAAILACLLCSAASAQSAVQCERMRDGSYQATLIWQNTLGAVRANAICTSFVQEQMPQAVAPQGDGGGGYAALSRDLSRFDDETRARASSNLKESGRDRDRSAQEVGNDKQVADSTHGYKPLW